MSNQDNTIAARFVLKALGKKAGVGKSSISQTVPGSKMVTSSNAGMKDPEIDEDVSKFNIARAKKDKKMVSAPDVKELAGHYQSSYLDVQAKKKEAEFRKKEEEREKAMLLAQQKQTRREDIDSTTMARRKAEEKKLTAYNKKSPGDGQKVKDMPID